ncbi:VanZ family protein [Rhizobium sp. SSA_523]|uniref:VanZ family protein n=1 Tax=Rhizobium sp. SSA_523 TaxID=2952477 RepID=UPI002091C508|nr:VanZ family protein [Rhizobium sp. SSA_523]MCO5731045.1 VanZ family protein [Rhizobium sp. SSA_523]WKC24152.1 VanZ family protein [Rhizobium sp. SSA_523]
MTSRLLKLAAWLLLAFVVFATVSPIAWRPHDVLPVNIDRALAFALLAGAFVIAYPRHFTLCAVVILCSTAVIEALQWIEPSRHARLQDVFVKAAGCCLGLGIGWFINRYRRRHLPS